MNFFLVLLDQEVIYITYITDLVGYSILNSGRAMKWTTKTVITLDWFLQVNNDNSLFYKADIVSLSGYIGYLIGRDLMYFC